MNLRRISGVTVALSLAGIAAILGTREAQAVGGWRADMSLTQLSVSKAGGVNTYTVKFKDVQDDSAAAVQMVFHVPTGKSLSGTPSVSFTGTATGVACNSSVTTYNIHKVLICTATTMNPGAEITATIRVGNAGGGPLTASAQVFSDVPEAFIAGTPMTNNFATLTQ